MGPRPIGSPAHAKLENYLRQHLKNDNLEEDAFTADTPKGKFPSRNFIAKFPGTKDGIIVIAGHYETKMLKNFVGANDGGASAGLLLELANRFAAGKKPRDGYSVWLVWFDAEEAVKEWSDTDSTYGSRHLAEKWQQDGTAKKIKGLLLLDKGLQRIRRPQMPHNRWHQCDSTRWIKPDHLAGLPCRHFSGFAPKIERSVAHPSVREVDIDLRRAWNERDGNSGGRGLGGDPGDCSGIHPLSRDRFLC